MGPYGLISQSTKFVFDSTIGQFLLRHGSEIVSYDANGIYVFIQFYTFCW